MRDRGESDEGDRHLSPSWGRGLGSEAGGSPEHLLSVEEGGKEQLTVRKEACECEKVRLNIMFGSSPDMVGDGDGLMKPLAYPSWLIGSLDLRSQPPGIVSVTGWHRGSVENLLSQTIASIGTFQLTRMPRTPAVHVVSWGPPPRRDPEESSVGDNNKSF